MGFVPILAQSPHGDELTINCAQCHDSEGWSMNYETIKFDHSVTDFQLEGTHQQTDCKLCHETLVFNEAPSQCVSCHSDIHSMSVGNDCISCHTTENWLVDDIPEEAPEGPDAAELTASNAALLAKVAQLEGVAGNTNAINDMQLPSFDYRDNFYPDVASNNMLGRGPVGEYLTWHVRSGRTWPCPSCRRLPWQAYGQT